MAFRVAVVGTGTMGRNHARVLAAMPETALAGVVDADPVAAREVAGMHGTIPRTFDEVLRDPKVDAVVIATPTATHHELATRALDHGKHVLAEKPLAAESAAALDLVQRARKAGRTLAVGHVERHNPVVRQAHDALARGEFGQLVTVTARRVSNFPGRIRDVGVLLDLGVHDFDVIRYLVGRDPVRVAADAGSFTEGLAFEDHAAVLLAFPGGVTGLVEVNWLTPMKVRRLSITCSEQYVEVDYISQVMRVSSARLPAYDSANMFQTPFELAERSLTLRRQEPLRLELEDFVRAARTGKNPLVTGEDGAAVLRIAEAAVRAARTGETVRLP